MMHKPSSFVATTSAGRTSLSSSLLGRGPNPRIPVHQVPPPLIPSAASYVPVTCCRMLSSSLSTLGIVLANTSSTTTSSISNTAGGATTAIFEPRVNLPALSAFLVIAVIFTLLQVRINSIRNASERRMEALQILRKVKSAQLEGRSSSSSIVSGDTSIQQPPSMGEEQVNDAIAAYKYALEEELALRTVLPGVRIVAPNDPKRMEADIAAAKQFLGLDLDAEGGLLLTDTEKGVDDQRRSEKDVGTSKKILNGTTSQQQKRDQLLLQSRRRFDGMPPGEKILDNKGDEGLSNTNKAILLVIATIQIFLLILLSFDPMTAERVFTVLGDADRFE